MPPGTTLRTEFRVTAETKLETALALHGEGRLDEAAEAYREILQSDPENVDGLYGLGTVLMQQKDPERAVDLLGRAAALAPHSPEIAFNYAMAIEQQGHGRPAAAAYLRAASTAPRQSEFIVMICRKLMQLGVPEPAYDLIQAVQPRSASIETLTAQAQAASGDWPGAVDKLRQLARTTSVEASVWREIAAAAARIQDFETALDAFSKYLSEGDPSGADYLDYADLLMAVRDLDTAESVLTDHEIEDRGRCEVMLAKVARLRNDMEACRQHLRAAIAAVPSNAEAWNIVLEIEPIESLPEAAEQVYALVDDDSATAPQRVTLALAAGRAFDRLGQYQKAYLAYEKGNSLQKQFLIGTGRAYGPASIERNFGGIMQRLSKPVPRAPAGEYAFQPIFIVGMPRSGTTLMEKILSCLDGVEAGGEVMAMEFVAAEYYRAHRDQLANIDESLRRSLVDRYWEWAGREPGLITDKMPHNFRNVGLIARLFPGSPVIYMRRDARDVILSIYARHWPSGHPYACDLEWLAHFYAQSVRIMDFWMTTYPDRVLEVHYEDLVDRPEAVTKEVAAFCRLEWSPACLEFDRQAGASFTFSEMQVRQPLNREGIGRWRHYEQELAPTYKLLTDNKII